MRPFRSSVRLICASLIALASTGCVGRAHRRAERERILQERIARDREAIQATCADWSKASQAKDLDKTMSFYADDALVLSPKIPLVQGKDNIRTGWKQMFLIPGPGLTFTTGEVQVARSDDLAWEHGAYDFATSDKKGKTTTEHGKYITIWKKQADGAWKVVADMDNPDQ
jgi:uncharacterized protein (TIGR02246 family)